MKALIIEDEDIIAKLLQNKIRNVDSSIDIIDVLPSLKVAKKWFMQNAEPDLIFMDIQLSDGVSFDLFDHYKLNCPVVFTTAYDEYALKAFKVSAIDYLLKPIKQPELEAALHKVVQQTKKESTSDDLINRLEEAGFIRKAKRLLVRMGQSIKLIDLDQVAYFYSKDKISFAVLPGNKRYPLDQSLDQIEHMVDPLHFFRINRQTPGFKYSANPNSNSTNSQYI